MNSRAFPGVLQDARKMRNLVFSLTSPATLPCDGDFEQSRKLRWPVDRLRRPTTVGELSTPDYFAFQRVEVAIPRQPFAAKSAPPSSGVSISARTSSTRTSCWSAPPTKTPNQTIKTDGGFMVLGAERSWRGPMGSRPTGSFDEVFAAQRKLREPWRSMDCAQQTPQMNLNSCRLSRSPITGSVRRVWPP